MTRSISIQLVLALVVMIAVDFGSAFSSMASNTASAPGSTIMCSSRFIELPATASMNFVLPVKAQRAIMVSCFLRWKSLPFETPYRPRTTSPLADVSHHPSRQLPVCHSVFPTGFHWTGGVVADPNTPFLIELLLKAIYALAAPHKPIDKADADIVINEGALDVEAGYQNLLGDAIWRRATEMYGDGYMAMMAGQAFHHHVGALQATLHEAVGNLTRSRNDDSLRLGGTVLASSIDKICYRLHGFDREQTVENDNVAMQQFQAALFEEMDRIGLCHADHDQMQRLAQHSQEQHRLLIAVYVLRYHDQTEDKA